MTTERLPLGPGYEPERHVARSRRAVDVSIREWTRLGVVDTKRDAALIAQLRTFADLLDRFVNDPDASGHTLGVIGGRLNDSIRMILERGAVPVADASTEFLDALRRKRDGTSG